MVINNAGGKQFNLTFRKYNLSPANQIHLSLNLRSKIKEQMKKQNLFQEPKLIKGMYNTACSEQRRKSIPK